MDIVEIKKKMFELEINIQQMFNDFESDTGCEIHGLGLDRSHEIGGMNIYRVTLDVKIKT